MDGSSQWEDLAIALAEAIHPCSGSPASGLWIRRPPPSMNRRVTALSGRSRERKGGHIVAIGNHQQTVTGCKTGVEVGPRRIARGDWRTQSLSPDLGPGG